MGSGSIGFQAGIQDAELIMCVLTDKGLAALLDDQFKIGADASIALLTVGAGVEGAITANVGADIVAFSETRGLFGGISLGGSLMTSDTGWNQAYYGRPLAARQIVIDMQANNPGADPLRAALMRFTPNQPPPPPGVPYAQAAQPAYAPPPAYAAGPAAAPATAVAPTAPVQSQPLPPPTR
jgi:lipid-binding SYLF domain-containing protein